MEERKITLVDDDQTLEFYVVEETKLNGANYLLVTDAEDDDEEGDCYILKDMSGADESDALYEFVEDEDELEGLRRSSQTFLTTWIWKNSKMAFDGNRVLSDGDKTESAQNAGRKDVGR